MLALCLSVLLSLTPTAAGPTAATAAPPRAVLTGAQPPLFAVGGGEMPPPLLRAALARAHELRGVQRPHVVIFPQASKGDKGGKIDVKKWSAVGAKDPEYVFPLTHAAGVSALRRADIVWFGGGNQERLVAALRDAKLVGALLHARKRGVLFGGTSAGASSLTKVMVSGVPRPRPLRRHAMGRLRGLGLWPEVVVDQHFAIRKRFGRLMTAVLDHPSLVGLGIGEDTGLLFEPDASGGGTFKVFGRRQVVVVDARRAQVASVKGREPQGVRDLLVHILRPGETWTLAPQDPALPQPKTEPGPATPAPPAAP